jgi:predicted enzyme related to lactoylglutathione lyase
MSSGFVWFEYVTSDLPAAVSYFQDLLGWTRIDSPRGGYPMMANNGRPIGGYVAPPPAGPPAHWCPLLQIDGMAAHVDKLQSLGGSVIKPPFPVGDMGTECYVADPLGGVFALWDPKPDQRGPADYACVDGGWIWCELYTQDPDASLAFYTQLVGFTSSTMKTPDGQPGPRRYDILEEDGKGRAGIMKLPNLPQLWMPYVQVADVDATLAKGVSLGATNPFPAETVPGVGRLAALLDPRQSALGLLDPSKM